jgi:hypothetical protein
MSKLLSLLAPTCNEVSNSSALYQLLAALAASASTSAQPIPGVLICQPGAPASGANGSWSRPFPSMTAAAASPQWNNVGSTLLLLPGTYTENFVLPAAARGTTILALSLLSTLLQPAAGYSITYAPTGAATGNELLYLQGLQFADGPGGGAFVNGLGLTGSGVIAILANLNDNSTLGSTYRGCNFVRWLAGRATGRRPSSRAVFPSSSASSFSAA